MKNFDVVERLNAEGTRAWLEGNYLTASVCFDRAAQLVETPAVAAIFAQKVADCARMRAGCDGDLLHRVG